MVKSQSVVSFVDGTCVLWDVSGRVYQFRFVVLQFNASHTLQLANS
jgi:hypothetical protein